MTDSKVEPVKRKLYRIQRSGLRWTGVKRLEMYIRPAYLVGNRARFTAYVWPSNLCLHSNTLPNPPDPRRDMNS